MGLGFKKHNKKNEKLLSEKEEQDITLIADLRNKFEIAYNAKSSFVKTWNECIDAYNSDYFLNTTKPDYKSDEVSNFIFSTIETIKPIMVDNDPQIQILPKTPKALEASTAIQSVFESEWHRDKMSLKLSAATTVALQIGTAVIMNRWNGNSGKTGNVENVIINPFNIFPDPMASDIDSCEYLIYATYKHVNQLKQKFPNKVNLLSGGTINYTDLVPKGSNISSVSNQVLVFECYIRDYTTIDSEENDENGNKIKVSKRKYPKGRIITIAPELNLILSDKENPYNDGKFPFKLLKCYDVPFQFWGKGEIEQLLSPQTYINDLINQIIDNAKLTANMPWVIDKNAGIGKGQLTNRPGLIIRKNPGSDVKRLAPPPMPNYVQELVETLKRDIEIISGIHDVTQGRKPGSISAASAIIALQDAAQARIRLKVKLMELSLGDLGDMWYSRLQQFWIVDRWIRFFDKDNNVRFVQITPEMLEVDVDFVIVSGSTMPQNRPAMFDLMIRLAQTMGEDGKPMVDRETVLEYASVPNKKKIVEKFSEVVDKEKAEAQALQEQDVAIQQAMKDQEQAMQMASAQQQHQNQMAQIQTKGALSAEAQTPSEAQIQGIINILTSNPELLNVILQQVGMSKELGNAPY